MRKAYGATLLVISPFFKCPIVIVRELERSDALLTVETEANGGLKEDK